VQDYQSSNNLIYKLIIGIVLDPTHIDQSSHEQYKYTLFEY